ncbi:MAG: tetratricopeptide repeat protein [Flavobacteriales bacterium]|nr:tetratricopeptide repeat protein [Flavobacteriales bacterium]MCB9334862.1 tetratricopeptide repeat protein [Flavobacteriales bacterium]
MKSNILLKHILEAYGYKLYFSTMRKWLIAFLLLFPMLGWSNTNFDSLWTVWQSPTQPDSSRLNAIYIISWNQFLFSNPDSAFNIAEEHFDFAKAKNNTEHMAIASGTKGVSFYMRANYYEAVKYYHQSLSLYEKIEQKQGQAQMLNNLGLIYKELEEYDTALVYYNKSLVLKESINDQWGISSTYSNIGNIYRKKGNHSKALEFHQKSLAIKKEVDDKKGMAVALNNIGSVLEDLGQLEEAIEHFRQGLLIFEETNNQKGIAGTHNNIGRIYYKQHNYDLAILHCKKAYQIATELGLVHDIGEAALTLYECNKALGYFNIALNMHETYITYRDSAMSDENKKNVLRQEYEYQYEKQKVIDDAEHEKQLAVEQEAKEKQQIITYATATGLVFLAIFLIFVFNRLKVTRKQKNMIEEAHTELEEKNKEILDSISYAKRIQSAILPPQKVVKEYLQESFILYKPKDIVAGDFYWLEHKDNKVLFAAADCTGHGVPGAMVSVICNNGLNRSVREHGLIEPGKILDKTREIVIQEFEKSEEEVKDGMDIALCSLKFMANSNPSPANSQQSTESRQLVAILEYAGANNPLWIIRKNAEEIEEIKADKQPIGKFTTPLPYTTHKVQLNEGDTIYIFSDGFADQFGGEKGKKFKAANFKKLLLSIQHEPIEKQRELIDDMFEKWKGDLEQLDDVCVIGVRV